MGRKRDKNFPILTVFWLKSHTLVPIEIKFGITMLKFNTIRQKSRLYAGQKPAKCQADETNYRHAFCAWRSLYPSGNVVYEVGFYRDC